MHAFKMAQLRSVNKSCLRWDALFGMLLSYTVIISLVFVIVGYLNFILYSTCIQMNAVLWLGHLAKAIIFALIFKCHPCFHM